MDALLIKWECKRLEFFELPRMWDNIAHEMMYDLKFFVCIAFYILEQL